MPEEPESPQEDWDASHDFLACGNYGYVVIYDRAKRLPPKNPLGFAVPAPDSQDLQEGDNDEVSASESSKSKKRKAPSRRSPS